LSDLGRAFEVWPQEAEVRGEGAGSSPVSRDSSSSPAPRDRWLRRGLAGAWVLFFAMGGLAVASTWDRLVQGLVRTPVPTIAVAPATGDPSPGERATVEARRLLGAGHPAEALAALAAIHPEEPVYPFALQLRDEARRALERGGQKPR
jgi:hypothetical protein